MTINRMLLDITPDEFPVISRKTQNDVLYPSSDRAESTNKPNWMQNLWPLSSDNLAAIVEVTGFLDDLPQDILDVVAADSTLSYIVADGENRAVLLTSDSAWHTYTQGGWVTNIEFAQAIDTSVARLKGKTYLSGTGTELYTYAPFDPQTELPFSELEVVATTGLNFTDMISMCAAVSYLIATDGERVYWSSPLDDTFWDPAGTGDQAGAGSTKVLSISGTITHLQTAYDGFYILTTNNIIRAKFTGNSRNPWSFTEVRNSSGVFYRRTIAQDTNLGTIFVWTDHGLATLRESECTYTFPAITELLSGDVLEYYNLETDTVDRDIGSRIDFSIHFIIGRYLAISYGLLDQPRSFILFYDTLGGKWGRLQIDHITVLEARTVLLPNGLVFARWLDTFDETLYTFDEMLGTDEASDVDALSLTVLKADGSFVELSPVDIDLLATSALPWQNEEYSVMPNLASWSGIKLTRNRELEISELRLYYRYPSYPNPLVEDGPQVYSTEDTEIAVSTYEAPTLTAYYLASEINGEELYVNRVVGTQAKLVTKNISSLSGLELGVLSSGRRTK